MFRGEIWWADLRKPIGRRPVLILSRSKSIAVREYVVVAFVSTRSRQVHSEVSLHRFDGMPRECFVNLDVINTVPKTCLVEKITALRPDKLQAIDEALKYSLDIS